MDMTRRHQTESKEHGRRKVSRKLQSLLANWRAFATSHQDPPERKLVTTIMSRDGSRITAILVEVHVSTSSQARTYEGKLRVAQVTDTGLRARGRWFRSG